MIYCKDADQNTRFYAQKNYNRSLNSNLVKLNQKLKKNNSINKLRRCSDLSRLNINEEEFCEIENRPDSYKEESNSLEMSCSNLVSNKSPNQSNQSLERSHEEGEEMRVVDAVTNGILKRTDYNKTSADTDLNINNIETASTVLNAQANGNGPAGVKMLSFKVSRDLEELTNGIRLASNSNKREKNVTYKLGLIMITFIVSWLPFCILWPLVSVCSKCVSEPLYLFSFWLAYLNSVFTPIILLYNNVKYRKSVLIIWRFFLLKPFNFVFRRQDFDTYNNNYGNISIANNNNNNTTNNDNYLLDAANSMGPEKNNYTRASVSRKQSLNVNSRYNRRSIKIKS